LFVSCLFVVCLLFVCCLSDYFPNLSLICKLLCSNSMKIRVINHNSQNLVRFSLDSHQILIRFSSDSHQILVRFSSDFCQILIRFPSILFTMVFFKTIVTYINSPQPRRLKAFSVLLPLHTKKSKFFVQ